MSFYAVLFTHYDLELRRRHLDAHMAWLDRMVEQGFVVSSGPLLGGPLASAGPVVALLIVKADSKAAVMQLIASDPFSIEGVTDGLTITEWRPVFGRLAAESGGVTAAVSATAGDSSATGDRPGDRR